MESVKASGGSEKQNAYATSILHGWIRDIDSEIAAAKPRENEGPQMAAFVKALEEGKSKIVAGAAKVNAKQIIELKNSGASLSRKIIQDAYKKDAANR